jgi:hypothetical protein
MTHRLRNAGKLVLLGMGWLITWIEISAITVGAFMLFVAIMGASLVGLAIAHFLPYDEDFPYEEGGQNS